MRYMGYLIPKKMISMKNYLLTIGLCLSGISFAQVKTSDRDISLADGYDMTSSTRTVTFIIPKSIPDATCLADYARAFDKPDYIPNYSEERW